MSEIKFPTLKDYKNYEGKLTFLFLAEKEAVCVSCIDREDWRIGENCDDMLIVTSDYWVDSEMEIEEGFPKIAKSKRIGHKIFFLSTQKGVYLTDSTFRKAGCYHESLRAVTDTEYWEILEEPLPVSRKESGKISTFGDISKAQGQDKHETQSDDLVVSFHADTEADEEMKCRDNRELSEAEREYQIKSEVIEVSCGPYNRTLLTVADPHSNYLGGKFGGPGC